MLSLCLHLSSLNLCLLITAVVVIDYGLDCFINSVLAIDLSVLSKYQRHESRVFKAVKAV